MKLIKGKANRCDEQMNPDEERTRLPPKEIKVVRLNIIHMFPCLKKMQDTWGCLNSSSGV